MNARLAWVCFITLLLSGCASIGPPAVVRDRFDYVGALSDSWKRQTLLNLLKVRYGEAPVLMEVTSVISAYTARAEVSAGGQVSPPSQRGDTFNALGISGQYSDQPTITYSPLTGDKFARNLMTPIPVAGILSLIQAGYPADLVLRICVNSVNGMDNDYGGPGNPRVGSAKFRDLMAAMRQAQAAGGAGFRTKSTKDKQSTVMFFRPQPQDAEPLVRQMRELLELAPSAREATIVYGSSPEPDGEVAILPRSMLQVMIDLASQIEVPAADVAEGRVYQRRRTPEQERMYPPLLSVKSGAEPPTDPHVLAVKYRNQWFWIDDRDPQSKGTLTFLMLAFSLTESAQTPAQPMVTIPAR